MDTLPPGYVTIAHLYERWLQRQQEEKEKLESEEKKELENKDEKERSGIEDGNQNVVVAVENQNRERGIKNNSNMRVSDGKGKGREQVESVKRSSFYGKGKGKGQIMDKWIVADGEHPSYIEGFDGGMLSGGDSGVLIRGGNSGKMKFQQGVVEEDQEKTASVKEGLKGKVWRRGKTGLGRVSGGGSVLNNNNRREYRVKEGAGEDGEVTFGSGNKKVEDDKKGGYDGRRKWKEGRRGRVNRDSNQEKKDGVVEDDSKLEKKANSEVLDAVIDGNAATLGESKGSTRNKKTRRRRFGGRCGRYVRTDGPNLKQRNNQEDKEDEILKPEKEDSEMVMMASGDHLTVSYDGNGFLPTNESITNKTRGQRVGGRERFTRTGRYGHRPRQEQKDGKRMVWVKRDGKSGPDAAHEVGSSV